MKEEKFKGLILKVPCQHFTLTKRLEGKLEKAQKSLQDWSCKNNQQKIIVFLKKTASLSPNESNEEIIFNNSLTNQKNSTPHFHQPAGNYM